MIMFFSGSGSKEHRPEVILADRDPGVMLTYYAVFTKEGETVKRMNGHIKRRKKKNRKVKNESK